MYLQSSFSPIKTPWLRYVRRLLANIILTLFTFCLFFLFYSVGDNYKKTVYFMKSINEIKYSMVYDGNKPDIINETNLLNAKFIPPPISDEPTKSIDWQRLSYLMGDIVTSRLIDRPNHKYEPNNRYFEYCKNAGYLSTAEIQDCSRKLEVIDFKLPSSLMTADEIYDNDSDLGIKKQVILFWSEKVKLKFVRHTFMSCRVKNCVMVPNDAFYYPYVDAVIFIITNKRKRTLPRKWRLPHQKWIFFNREPPVNIKINMNRLDGFFNWTMSYRTDSDVHIPWGQTVKRGSKEEFENAPESLDIGNSVIDYDEAGDGLISASLIRKADLKMNARSCWFVSHCKTESRREEVTRKLSRYMPIDVYGSCGSLECPRKPRHVCQRVIERDYKFYLSFENSLCREYITEKVFDTLQLDIIPVVYGGANYTALLPPHSFIDVRSFKDLESLATYLHHLDTHPQEYLAYFAWRRWYRVLVPDPFCRLCQKLNDQAIEERVAGHNLKSYDNFGRWWKGSRPNRMCTPVEVIAGKIVTHSY